MILLQFDDQDHMKDADPTLMSKCKEEVMHLKCNQEKSFEDIVECLRTNFDELGKDDHYSACFKSIVKRHMHAFFIIRDYTLKKPLR